MLRSVVASLFRVGLWTFYRRIEVVGIDKMAAEGPVIMVANHPNSLVDPASLLLNSPRPVSFLAKSTLFDMGLIGPLVRAFDSIPVYRKIDKGVDTSKNQETFATARRVLEGGGVLALFPEGVSHDEPKLLPLKTGAARIALGVAGDSGRVQVLPVGLVFTHKGRFRSDLILRVGDPIAVQGSPDQLDEQGQPQREPVQQLTQAIEEALRAEILEGQSEEELMLSNALETLLRREPESLSGAVEVQRRLLLGKASLARLDPDRAAALEREGRFLARATQRLGLSLRALRDTPGMGTHLAAAARLAFLALPAVVGIVANFVPYELVRRAARWRGRGEGADLQATIKVLFSMLAYPVWWTLLAAAVSGIALNRGATSAPTLIAGVLTWLSAPLGGWAALAFSEQLERTVGWARDQALRRVCEEQLTQIRERADRLREQLLRAEAELEV